MSAKRTTRNAGDQHQNEGQPGKYYHQMLNMADDDLGPFEYRLLGHYIRVCGAEKGGVCYQTVRVVASATKMSIPKVIATRNALLEGGWIRVEERANKTHLITVVDRMKENVDRYSVQNVEHTDHQPNGDQNIEHGDQNIEHGDQYPAYEEEPYKKNPQEEPQKEQELAAQAPPVDAGEESQTLDDKPPTPHQRMFGAICDAFGYRQAALTKSKRSQLNGTVGELMETNATPDDMPAFKAWMDEYARKKQWSGYSVSALAKYWPDFDKEHNAPPPPVLRANYGDATLESMWDERIAEHERLVAADGYREYLTPEERAAEAAQSKGIAA